MKHLTKSLLLAALAMWSAQTIADFHIYRYTGVELEYAGPEWVPIDYADWVPNDLRKIELEIVMSQPPGATYSSKIPNNYEGWWRPSKWSFTDGHHSIGQWDEYYPWIVERDGFSFRNRFWVKTNDVGEIVSWWLRPYKPFQYYTLGLGDLWMVDTQSTPFPYDGVVVCVVDPCQSPYDTKRIFSYNAGSWSYRFIPSYYFKLEPEESSRTTEIDLNENNQDRPLHFRILVYRDYDSALGKLIPVTDVAPPMLRIWRTNERSLDNPDDPAEEVEIGGTAVGIGNDRHFTLKGNHWHYNLSLEGMPPGYYWFGVYHGSDDYTFWNGDQKFHFVRRQ